MKNNLLFIYSKSILPPLLCTTYTTEDNSFRRIMRPEPVSILGTFNQTNKDCLPKTSQYKFGFWRAGMRNKIFSNLRHRGSEKLIQTTVIAGEIINSCIAKVFLGLKRNFISGNGLTTAILWIFFGIFMTKKLKWHLLQIYIFVPRSPNITP